MQLSERINFVTSKKCGENLSIENDKPQTNDLKN